MYGHVKTCNKESTNLGDCDSESLPKIDALEECNISTTAKLDAKCTDGAVAAPDNEDKPEDFIFGIDKSVCSVNIGDLDLVHITNGFIGDPIEQRPFDYCFQMHKLINQWIKVGFLPMTSNAVISQKVNFERGKGGVPAHISDRIEMLVEEYEPTGERF